jgi:hypothetical protein
VVARPAHQPAAPHIQEVESTDAYLHRLGLGNTISVFFVFSAEDPTCMKQVNFYKRLLAVPGMDGKSGRLIMFTRDGLVPALQALKARSLTPHATGSFPTALGVDTPGLAKGNLPTALGSIAILDKAGALLKSWEGFLSAAQQEEVLGFVQRSLK